MVGFRLGHTMSIRVRSALFYGLKKKIIIRSFLSGGGESMCH